MAARWLTSDGKPCMLLDRRVTSTIRSWNVSCHDDPGRTSPGFTYAKALTSRETAGGRLQGRSRQGYGGASVRDIVRAAGVPQGSFTNHFTSKEAFAQEVLDRYFSLVRGNIEKTLRMIPSRPSAVY